MSSSSSPARSTTGSRRRRRLAFEPLEQRQLLDAAPVISEFMAVAAGPLRDDDGETPDWIEIHNTGDMPADLSGWHLSNAATDLSMWRIPEVTLDAGERLVVFASGKNRTKVDSPLHTKFTLDGGGGYLALVEPDGMTIASVFEAFPDQKPLISYGLSSATGPHAGESRAFVSPTPGEPNGIGFASPDSIGIVINEINYNTEDNTELTEFIELVNTNDFAVDVSGWFFDDGVDFTFPEGSTIGPDETVVITENAEHLKQQFDVDAVGEFGNLLGEEAARTLSNEGERVGLRAAGGGRVDVVDYGVGFPWPVLADGEGASIELINPALDNDLAGSWRSSGFTITGAATLKPPSPGSQNSVLAANAPPQTRQVKHEPMVPASGELAVITAKVTDPDGVESVELLYQVVLPGEYIPSLLANASIGNPPVPRQPNPAFEDPANWTTVAMVDDGSGGDDQAGDGRYTATVPGQINRTLMRYRIEVADKLGSRARLPYADDPSLNFAYYVYDGVPDYTADVRSVGPDGEGTVYDADTLTGVPVYSLITRNSDIRQVMAYSSNQIPQGNAEGRRAYNWEGALVYDGIVYDHIDYRLRGANGRYHLENKRSMRLRFNRGHQFAARDRDGELYKNKWRFLNVSKMFGNRLSGTFGTRSMTGSFGLTESVNNFLWNTVGVAAPETHWFHFRVVDGVEEAPDQYSGDFWGMFLALERYDVDFLDQHDLPSGNLYKLRNATSGGKTQQRYQAALAPASGQDYNLVNGPLDASKSEEWLRTYVDWDNWYRYKAVVEAIRHYDYWPTADKNMAYYFTPADNPVGGKLQILPFDSDASWGPSWNNGEDRPTAAIGGKPVFQKELDNYIRELRDLLWQPDQIEPLIDYFASFISDIHPADRDRWRLAPAVEGSFDFGTLDSKVRDMKLFAFTGNLDYPGGSVGAGGRGAHLDNLARDTTIPDTPTLAYLGGVGFPINELTFTSSAFGDPQGAATFGKIKWRIAEVTDPKAPAYDPSAAPLMEYNAVWEAEFDTQQRTVTIPVGVVTPGHAYRVRVQMKDDTDRWSHWSDPVELIAGFSTGVPIEFLKITEINYNPGVVVGSGRDNDDFEFIELKNTGGETIDLRGVRFTDGIRFDFTDSNVTILAGGEYVLVVKNQEAFESRYEDVDTARIAGEFASGSLRNSGENITLIETSTDRVLHDFEYGGGWYKLADGDGFSLSLRTEDAATGDLGLPQTWRPSTLLHGSPGVAESGAVPLPGKIVFNEVMAHSDAPQSDWIELRNLTDQAIDVGGWFLTDQSSNPKAYQIPDETTIPKNGFLLLTEADHFGDAFELSELGDDLFLQAGLAGEVAGFRVKEDFGASEQDVAIGRYIKSNDRKDFVALVRPTPGAANAKPVVGPVVIQEFLYHPQGGVSEFVELRNITDQNISLAGWYFDAIRFTLPEGTQIAPDGLLVVSPLSPDEFRQERGLPESVAIFGPYLGSLNNGGESLKLLRPGIARDDGAVPEFLIDRVTYDNKLPWPLEADEDGASLQRVMPGIFGNDPQSWVASLGGSSPGDIFPQVTEVLVGGSGWSPAFLDAVADRNSGKGGWSIATGAEQLTPLAQQSIDTISLHFSLDVQVTRDDLIVSGVNQLRYPIAGFEYDAKQFLATWTLQQPVRADKLLLQLGGVTDKTERSLDGNWDDGVSSFPSGDGLLEVDESFSFRLNVLAADANRDGRVDRADLVAAISRIGTTADDSTYSLRLDVNADGRIDAADLRGTLLALGGRLPIGDPQPGVLSPAIAAVEAVFTRLAGAAPEAATVAAGDGVGFSSRMSGESTTAARSTDRPTRRPMSGGLSERSLGRRLRRRLDRESVDVAFDEALVDDSFSGPLRRRDSRLRRHR